MFFNLCIDSLDLILVRLNPWDSLSRICKNITETIIQNKGVSVYALADLGGGGAPGAFFSSLDSLAINVKHNFNRNMAKTR